MASAIGPGDWVECVDAAPRYVPGYGQTAAPEPLVVGSLYLVERLVYAEDWDEHGVVLVGICNPVQRDDGAYWIGRFRPIYTPKQEIIEALKQPAPEMEPA